MFLCAAVIAGEQIENAGDLLAMIGGHVEVVNGYSIANREVMSPNFPVNLARQEGLDFSEVVVGPNELLPSVCSSHSFLRRLSLRLDADSISSCCTRVAFVS